MILCCGEALIDMLPRRTAAGEPAFAPYPGGAVFNTAIALGRLGVPTGLFTGLSSDLFGSQLRAALTASKVDHRLTATSDRPTTLAFVQIDDGQARYAFYDENTATRLLSKADLPALPDTVETLFFGGISLMVEPCGSTFENLMAREAAARVTMIDPNIRPAFIANRAAYTARMDRMLALADIVKLSDEDLFWLEGRGDIATLARGLLARGPKLVLVTEGARGAHAFSARHDVFQPAQKVAVADTVGAGDTFNAGVLAALLAAGKLSKSALAGIGAPAMTAALALGVRTAAVTVARPGANPPWLHELT